MWFSEIKSKHEGPPTDHMKMYQWDCTNSPKCKIVLNCHEMGWKRHVLFESEYKKSDITKYYCLIILIYQNFFLKCHHFKWVS